MGTLITRRPGYQHCRALFLVFCVPCLSVIYSAAYVISRDETDRLALLEFKAKITADPLGIMGSWNNSTHFCNWFGITCERPHRRVTKLNLTSSQLGGSISPHIRNLSFLRVVDLTNNRLINQIPTELGYLHRLERLDLDCNSLSGEIPSNLSRCSELVYLDLSNNKLVGGIPEELGSLSKLQELHLYNDTLTGGVPPSLGNLSSLETLSIAANNLVGSIPDTLGRLNQLVCVTLGSNKLSGTVPGSIFNLSSITQLNIEYNHLQGYLPPDLFITLPDLQMLYVAMNQLTGSIPTSLSNASNLEFLDLRSNLFTGKIPCLQKSKTLHYFCVYNNSLGTKGSDELNFLCSLTNATDLQMLAINSNELGGSIPECISNLSSKLTYFNLGENHISGGIPPGVANLVGLTILNATQNKLSGKVPSLQKLNTLQALGMEGNSLGNRASGDLNFLCSLTNATDLQTLAFSSNNLGGSIPECISNLSSKLTYFNLGENHISGGIPPGIANLVGLTILNATQNKLSGKVPSLQKLNALQVLGMEGNSLGNRASGDLNFLCSLTNATDLQTLAFSSNNLGGSIPECISNLSSKLTYFYLGENHISGGIPDGIANLVSLTILDAQQNKLSGKVPSLQKLNALQVLGMEGNSLGNRASGDLNFLCSLTNATDLQTLAFRSNNLGGSIPECISNLSSKLTYFNLGENHIPGGIPAGIANLVSLTILDAAQNKLSGKVPSLQKLNALQILSMGDNYLGNGASCDLNFLCSFTNATNLLILEVSTNNLGGWLPECITNLSSELKVIWLENNHISGPISADIGKSVSYLSLGGNNIYGRIPQSLCNATKLDILDLRDNHLEGTIPDCLIALSQTLGVLNLRRNNIGGTIPNKFVKGCRLDTLDFNGNLLQGQIPTSLAKCKELKILNLGSNQLHDNFPCELKTLFQLQVLILKSNKLNGNIACPGRELFWPLLQILDLSSNQFSGKMTLQFIPESRLMITGTKELQMTPYLLEYYSNVRGAVNYYRDGVILTFKNNDFEVQKVLKIFSTIDLSNNAFHGDIPKELGNLNALIVLDLSHNSLSGNIPTSFGNLSQLESLDLSCNALSGNIPRELANLNFLECLNLSFNKLAGPIPRSTQIQSFDASSYQGNPGLYGPPLTGAHANVPGSKPSASGDGSQWRSKSEMKWMLRGAQVGFPVGLTIFVGPLLYIKRWRQWYCRHLGRLVMKVMGREDQSRRRRGRRQLQQQRRH